MSNVMTGVPNELTQTATTIGREIAGQLTS